MRAEELAGKIIAISMKQPRMMMKRCPIAGCGGDLYDYEIEAVVRCRRCRSGAAHSVFGWWYREMERRGKEVGE